MVLLDAVLGSRAKVRILRALVAISNEEVTESELARRVGMSRNTVNLAVRELERCGAVDIQEEPSGHRVSLSGRSRLSRDLAELFQREARTLGELAGAVRRVFPEDSSCVLFGSVARGTEGAGSDVDVVIVAPTLDRAAGLSLEAGDIVRRFLPLPVRFIYYTPGQLRRKWNIPLIQAIRREGILLGGKPLEAWR